MFPYNTSTARPCPSLLLRITNNLTGLQLGPFPAVIDTGADVTCIPNVIATESGAMLEPYSVGYADGRQEQVRAIHLLDVKIEFMDINGNLITEKTYQDLIFPVISEGLLGRDILNLYVCEFDGPDQKCIINW